jgi:hypothetical protein
MFVLLRYTGQESLTSNHICIPYFQSVLSYLKTHFYLVFKVCSSRIMNHLFIQRLNSLAVVKGSLIAVFESHPTCWPARAERDESIKEGD